VRRVLVVDDEENIRVVLKALLRRHNYEVEVVSTIDEALALLEPFGPDVVLTDVRLPGKSGLDLLATLRTQNSPVTVIVMSAFGNIDLALEAIKAGAYDYVQKPFRPDEIVLALRKAEEREALRRENRALKEEIRKVLGQLTLRERQVIELRFGLSDDHDHTLEEVGKKLKVTRERVRQIPLDAVVEPPPALQCQRRVG